MNILAGWAMFGILMCVNTAIYIGISLAFENDFWREDVLLKSDD